jgi:hypothetical protein
VEHREIDAASDDLTDRLVSGNVVDGARVTQISFPSITSHTLHGDVHHIAGPSAATIKVPNVGTIENVPLRARSNPVFQRTAFGSR